MSFGDFLWSLVIIFFMIVYFMILFNILTDLFHSHDIGGFAKTLWVLFLLFIPFLSMLIYLIARGSGMAERGMQAYQRAQAQQQEMARTIVAQSGDGAGSGAAAQIQQAKQLLDSGAITQQEFDRIKAKALA